MLAGIALSLPIAAGAARADFQDNIIGYRYGTQFKEPGVANGADIAKHILNFTHVDSYAYGSNFFSADWLLSDSIDPAYGGGTGAQEVYIVYRHDLSLNKVTGTKTFAIAGIIRDVAIHAGMDFNTKNTSFAPGKRLLVVGPQLEFDVPGFFNVAFNYSREWNNNGIVGKSVDFDPAFEIEAAWGFKFPACVTTVNVTGFFNYVAAKGRNGFGNQTKYEILTRPELLFDAGQPFGKKGFVELGVGYEYWLNKFGNDAGKDPGALARTPMILGKVHF